MKKLLILIALALFGCDDEAVIAKVESALVNGGIAAQMRCSGLSYSSFSWEDRIGALQYPTPATIPDLEFTVFLDGSSFLTYGALGSPKLVQFNTRAAGPSFPIIKGSNVYTSTVEDGEVTWSSSGTQLCQDFGSGTAGNFFGPCSITYSFDDAACTGLNLQAFGVEP